MLKHFVRPFYFEQDYTGHHLLKSKNNNYTTRHCTPSSYNGIAFAPRQTVICAYANGCSGIRKRLFGRTQTLKRAVLLPIQNAP